jgi:hypothetical protein
VPVAPPGFDLLRPLGAGSSSVVWSATCVALGDTVALKWPRSPAPEALAGLRREAGLLDAVDHPNVVRAYDVVEVGDGPVLVLEHAAGGSLADALVRRTRLPAAEVALVGAGIARGLEALHAAGVVHGDVKPSNVLLGDGGRPLLADLGAARRVGDAPGDGTVTASAPYLDPAVLDGAAPDERSDVYAVGVTLHEALTGALPGVASATHGGAPTHGPAEGPLVALIARATHPDPAVRTGGAGALAAELEALAAATTPADGPTAAPHVPVPLAPLASEGADERATRSFGPRPAPPPSEPPEPPGHGGRVALAAAGLTVAVLVSPFGPLLTTPATAGAPPCPALVAEPGGVAADIDGDGCRSVLRWDGRVLTVPGTEPPARYTLGRPGDTLLMGDWDCDGRDAPALHRPATGEVVVFEALPAPGEAVRGRRAPRAAGGRASVVTGEDGCDAVDVVR